MQAYTVDFYKKHFFKSSIFLTLVVLIVLLFLDKATKNED